MPQTGRTIARHDLALEAACGVGSYEWRPAEDRLLWSPELIRMYGLTQAPAAEEGFSRLVHPEDRGRVEAETSAYLGSDAESYSHSFRIIRGDGAVRFILDRGTIERDENGIARVIRGLNVDLTDVAYLDGRSMAGNRSGVRRVEDVNEIEGKLRESEARLRLFIENAPASIAQFDRQMRYIAVSRRWLKDYGVTGDIIGRSHYEVFPEVPETWKEVHRRSLGGEIMRSEGDRFERADGSVQWVKWETLPWRDADGKVGGILIATEDVTQRKQAEEALRESEERLLFIADRAQVGHWHWEIAADRLEWSPLCKRLFGIPPEEPMSYERFLAALHPDDCERTDRAVRACLESGGQWDYDIEYRTKWPDGTVRWIHAKGDAVFEDGKPVRMAGIALDITERRQAEEALIESENRYKRLVEQTTDGIFLATPDGHYIDVNLAGCEMLGMTREEVLASTFTDVLHPDELARLPGALAGMADGNVYHDEWRYRRKDGAVFIGELSGRQLSNGCFQGVLRDITARKKAEEQTKLLLKEVNHRAKNMLMLVQAIARRTAATGADDFLDRFGERIQALAASQDLLIKGEWNGVSLSELVCSQMAPFQDLTGTRIEIGGPSLLVSASAAQTLGMVIHELATNAGKYGALSANQGRVAISWSLERDGAGSETFTMSWREEGGPPVAPPSMKGFGSKVIGPLAESSLDARVDLDFRETGLFWRLQCPASGVIEGTLSAPAAEARSEHKATRSSRPKVLVVEDETLVAMEIAHVLRHADFEVLGPARTAAQALSLLDEIGCDAAVLDINLGGETSELVARRLLANGTKFVTLSGYAPTQHPPIFKGVPALTKPLRPDLLIAEIKRCLESKENCQGELSG